MSQPLVRSNQAHILLLLIMLHMAVVSPRGGERGGMRSCGSPGEEGGGREEVVGPQGREGVNESVGPREVSFVPLTVVHELSNRTTSSHHIPEC